MAGVSGNAGLEVLNGPRVSLLKPFPLNHDLKPLLLLFSFDPRKLPCFRPVFIPHLTLHPFLLQDQHTLLDSN